MAAHSSLAFSSAEGKPLSLTGETAFPVAGKEVSPTRLLAEAVEATGCSEKDAAISQGYEPAYWSRIKSGEKQAHLDRIGRLPERVQREFVKRYAQELKMRISEEDTERAAALELAEAALRYARLRA